MWDWLLCPLGWDQFLAQIQSSSTLKNIVISDRGENWYEMRDSEDNLVTLDMMLNYIEVMQKNKENDKPIQFGKEVKLFTNIAQDKTSHLAEVAFNSGDIVTKDQL